LPLQFHELLAALPTRHNPPAVYVYISSVDFPPGNRRIASEFVRSLLSSLHRLPALPILLAVLLAARPSRAQDSSTATGYPVRGTVVNAITGQPIARALVSLNQDQAMLTNSDGEFSFGGIAPGEYSVSVDKPGYLGFGGSMRGMIVRVGRGGIPPHPEPPRRIQVGPDMPALTFPIAPLAMIVGRLTLSTADPADGIQVQVFRRTLQNGRPHWSLAGQSRSRSDGSFRVANLEPGSYMVATGASLDRPGQATNSAGPIWGYPALYYPGVTEATAAGTLTLAAGQQAEADITLLRQQFFPVTGIVHSPEDTHANFDILDSAGRSIGLSANYDRREGVVRSAVPNGAWTMEAHGYGRTMQWGSTAFQVDGAPVAFALSVLPVPHIPIVVRREFLASTDPSQPVDTGPGMNLTLIPADEAALSMNGGGGMMHTDNNASGSEWALNVQQPGRYWIQAQAFPPAYISSITSGGVDLGSNPLAIVPGTTPAQVEVTLRNDPGTITGQIATLTTNSSGTTETSGPTPTSGEHLQLWIYAIPLFSTPANLPTGSLQANGQFTIPNLAPGSYRVVACDSPQEIDFHSAEGLAAWAGKGQTVSVEAGGTTSVDLDILHIATAPE
jgi:hypothetical protein